MKVQRTQIYLKHCVFTITKFLVISKPYTEYGYGLLLVVLFIYLYLVFHRRLLRTYINLGKYRSTNTFLIQNLYYYSMMLFFKAQNTNLMDGWDCLISLRFIFDTLPVTRYCVTLFFTTAEELYDMMSFLSWPLRFWLGRNKLSSKWNRNWLLKFWSCWYLMMDSKMD